MLLNILFGMVMVIPTTYSARILGIVSTPSFSHQIVFRPIWRELSLRGHQLTVLTTDPMKDPTLSNLKEIDLSISYKKWNDANLNEVSNLNFFEMMEGFIKLGNDIAEEQLLLPEVQKLIHNKTEHFDLVMLELVFPSMAAFAEKFNCPLIQMISLEATSTAYHSFGNPSHPVLNPDVMLGLPKNLNFLERLISTGFTFFMKYYFHCRVIPSQDELAKQILGNNYLPLENILDRTAMFFVNTDNVFHGIRPLLPNIIQIGGGAHLTPPKPLPKELQKVLDDAKNGFIYFSLGSNIKSKRLPEHIRSIFLETFSELPYTVLWKFENEDLPGKPKNVIISKWFPQQDVLRHPNARLFVTQGGLQSSEEAIYSHVPLIGVPFIGDQLANVRKMVQMGIAQSVDYASMDKTILKTAILEVINNSSYRNRVKDLAELAKDQPMTGVERAVWWAEYVMRHKGASHLRSPALDLPNYQYFLLDVIGFCLVIVLVITFVLVQLVKLMFRILKRFVPKSKIKLQ